MQNTVQITICIFFTYIESLNCLSTILNKDSVYNLVKIYSFLISLHISLLHRMWIVVNWCECDAWLSVNARRLIHWTSEVHCSREKSAVLPCARSLMMFFFRIFRLVAYLSFWINICSFVRCTSMYYFGSKNARCHCARIEHGWALKAIRVSSERSAHK